GEILRRAGRIADWEDVRVDRRLLVQSETDAAQVGEEVGIVHGGDVAVGEVSRLGRVEEVDASQLAQDGIDANGRLDVPAFAHMVDGVTVVHDEADTTSRLCGCAP